ncbi:MAG: MATE family efflux transporter, partial [Planctomycetales bacterium]|nr:MATE family efflux transporter [Planctomycetales bacterium]
SHSDHGPEVQQLESIYYQTTALGAGAGIISVALSSFFTGISRTRVVMIVNAFAALMNIGLDVLLIFGFFGLPALGMMGAALATVAAQWIKVACYVYVIRREGLGREFSMSNWRIDWKLLRRMFSYGGQSGLQVFIETGAFTVFVIVMGQLGEDELAANTLAFSVNMLAFLPVLGIGMAVSTLVGQQLGRDRADLAGRATYTALVMGAMYAGFMAILFVSIPEILLMAHLGSDSPEKFQRLRELSIVLLRFVACYTLLDMTHIVFVSAIKGAGDTKFVLVATVIISATATGLGICGQQCWDWTLYQFWIVLTSWICLLGVVYWLRFAAGQWQGMRVIEQEFLREA